MQHGATSSMKDGPSDTRANKRAMRKVMCGTMRWSEGCNLSRFKSLHLNSDLMYSLEHVRWKSNCSVYPCGPCRPLCLCTVSSPRIPKVCVDVWPVVCRFPETQINKGRPSWQPIHGDAGSINISYVQLSLTVQSTDRHKVTSAVQDVENETPSPHCSASTLITWMAELFLWISGKDVFIFFYYQHQIDKDKAPQASKVPPVIYYWLKFNL